jgi:glycosyltransferase involved in cell wall biosynthesis
MGYKMLISIITVVYNGEKYLEQTIKSIINQTYDNIEYIIIDGGSTDGTIDIIKKYENKIDYWISEKDEGIYDAMNKGILRCNGEIIGIVNADDYIYEYTLKMVADALQDSNIFYTYGSIHLMNEKSKIFGEYHPVDKYEIEKNKYKTMPFSHPSVFAKKSVYKEIGLFNTNFKFSADYDFILRMIENRLLGIKLPKHTGVFRTIGVSGGMNSILDNYKVLVNRKIDKSIIYKRFFNTLIKLMLSKYLPKFVVDILRKLNNNKRYLEYK